MTETTDIRQLLMVATRSDRPAGDPLDDLKRARSARTRRTARRARLTLSGVALGSIFGVVVAAGIMQTDRDAPQATPAVASVRLTANKFQATPFTFDLTPVGWSVQDRSPSGVTIAPDDGTTSADPNDFQGKLVIMFSLGTPTGRKITVGGRGVWVTDDSEYVTLSTPTGASEPAGIVQIQYPRTAGWDVPTMARFLASVHVGPGAQPGLG